MGECERVHVMCEVEERLARDFVAFRWQSYTDLMLLDHANGQ